MAGLWSVCDVSRFLCAKSSASCTCDCYGLVVAKSPCIKNLFLIECVGWEETGWVSTILVLQHVDPCVLQQWHHFVHVTHVLLFNRMKNSVFQYTDEQNTVKKLVLLISTPQTTVKQMNTSEFFRNMGLFVQELPSLKTLHQEFILRKYCNPTATEGCIEKNGAIQVDTVEPFVCGILAEYIGHGIFILEQQEATKRRIPFLFSYYKLSGEHRRRIKVPQIICAYNVHCISIESFARPVSLQKFSQCLLCCSISCVNFEYQTLKRNHCLYVSVSQSALAREAELFSPPQSFWILRAYERIAELFSGYLDRNAQTCTTDNQTTPHLLSSSDKRQRLHETIQPYSTRVIHAIELQIVRNYRSLIFQPARERNIYNEFMCHNTECIASITADVPTADICGPSIFSSLSSILAPAYLTMIEQENFPG